jgi:hypothetical protein
MKLTVGPLPSAVYWRRRAILLAALLVTVSVLWVSISSVSHSESAKPTAHPAKTTTLLTPGLGLDSTAPASSPAGPAAPVVTTPPPAAVVPAVTPCADTEIAIAPIADPNPAPRGATVRLTLKIKNISARTCSRDLGADAQELYIQLGAEKMWSSDACSPLHGSSVQNLTAGAEQAFFVSWTGKASNAGCDEAKRVAPPVGKYQLFGRLATKISDPFVLTLT